MWESSGWWSSQVSPLDSIVTFCMGYRSSIIKPERSGSRWWPLRSPLPRWHRHLWLLWVLAAMRPSTLAPENLPHWNGNCHVVPYSPEIHSQCLTDVGEQQSSSLASKWGQLGGAVCAPECPVGSGWSLSPPPRLAWLPHWCRPPYPTSLMPRHPRAAV